MEKYELNAQDYDSEKFKVYQSEIAQEDMTRRHADAAKTAFDDANTAARETEQIGIKLEADRAMLDILLNQSKNLDERTILERIQEKRKSISENVAKFDAAVLRYEEHKEKMDTEAEKANMEFKPLEVYDIKNGAQTKQVQTQVNKFETDILTEISVANAIKAFRETKALGEELELSQAKLNYLKDEKSSSLLQKIVANDIVNMEEQIQNLQAAYDKAVKILEMQNLQIKNLKPENELKLLEPYALNVENVKILRNPEYISFTSNFNKNLPSRFKPFMDKQIEDLKSERVDLVKKKEKLVNLWTKEARDEKERIYDRLNAIHDEITNKIQML